MGFVLSVRRLNRVLAGTPYGRYTIGNLSTSSGMWMIRLSTGWIGWELTQSAIWLGVLAFADLVPAIACAPIAGVLADRMDRLVLLRRTIAIGMVVSACVAAAFYAGVLGIWLLTTLTLLQGIINSLTQPVRLTIVSELVARVDVPQAVAINAISFNVARFLGPMVGGAIIVMDGAGPTFLLNIALAAIFLQQLRGLVGRPVGDKPREAIFANALAGMHYLLAHRNVLPLLLQAACIGLSVRPVAELLPAIAEKLYSGGAFTLTLLTSSMGLGALLGCVWFSGLGTLSRVILLIGVNGLIAAAANILVAFGPLLSTNANVSLALGMVAMAATGFGTVTSGVAMQTTLQLVVEDSVRGRTMSSYAMIVRAAPALGALVLGILAERFGLQIAVVITAPICLLSSLWILLRRESIQAELDRSLYAN